MIPDKFRQGQYLEGLGEEQQVSLQLPILKQLLIRAARTFPQSPFRIFRPIEPPMLHASELHLPTLMTSTEEDELSLSNDEWLYPPTPPCLPPLELPICTFMDMSMHTAHVRPLRAKLHP